MPVPKGYREKSAGFPAGKCAPGSFRVKVLAKSKRIVTCCPKRMYKNGRCKVGTRGVKIQIKKG